MRAARRSRGPLAALVLARLVLATLFAAPAGAQDAAAGRAARLTASITEERVREVVGWLAADERLGRDSPSPGLEAAAARIEGWFAEAGLRPGAADSFRHRYTLPGLRIDSTRASLRLEWRPEKPEGEPAAAGGEPEKRSREFGGDAEVRLLRAGDLHQGTGQPAVLVRAGDPRLSRLFELGGGRRPMVLEVAEDDPRWAACAGQRQVLGRGLRGASPVFLVRSNALADVPAGAAVEASWTVSGAEPADVPLTNLVGVLPGSTRADEFVVVSAHYDHLGLGRPEGGDAIYNGADDNASGTTAVVLLAAALAELPRPARSIAFVCFSAEEKGLRGSQAFVAAPPFPIAGMVANLNIEMIGRPPAAGPATAWLTGRGYSDFADIAAPALARAGVELVDFDLADALFAASDNLSFARAGVVAHTISAGSLHAQYHRPGDAAELLDTAHMTTVIRGLAEVALELAERPARPAWNDAGRARLERLGR